MGLTKLKFTQETFNPKTDNAELMLADYWSASIEPEPPIPEAPPKYPASITYNGAAPTIKVGGSYKIFTPVFHDESVTVNKWTVSDEDGDIMSDTANYTIEYDGSQLKLKVSRNYYLINKVLTVQVDGSDGSTAELKVGVVG